MEEHGNPLQDAPTHIQPLLQATPTHRSRMAFAKKHCRRPNKKQNNKNHKNGNMGKNHLLQPHLDNQRKTQILSQNPNHSSSCELQLYLEPTSLFMVKVIRFIEKSFIYSSFIVLIFIHYKTVLDIRFIIVEFSYYGQIFN